ncbi:hypothetical protein [Chitinophaga sp. YIM B06452]|uniref:hypothetical protein n=1 Tax=Chitinophaga sp. YIM B06452 TaxID=3082158 RepID=UPI0031FF0E3B
MKKALKRIFIFLVVAILVCIAVLYYLITYRFKESLRYAVKMQTKGQYVFDAGSAEVSFGKRAITLRHSSVHCIDRQHAPTAYDIEMPELYFSLASWKDLLLNRKIVVDSLAFISPHVKMNTRPQPAKQRAGFKGTDILDILQKTLMHFNAHSFSMRNGSYDYLVEDSLALHVNDINLYLQNFTEINNKDDHLFGSDRVVFSLGRQHWILPKRKQDVSFSSLRFDSRGQRLELDSINYTEQDSTGGTGLSLQADKIFFNSRHLPALYQHNRLLIDTLTCLNPVLTVPPGRKSGGRRDTLQAVNRMPFGFLQIGFINVVSADVHLQGRQAASRNSNLRIYNLRVNPQMQRPLSIDSVRMDLREMVFYSRDSLYQMRIDEFSIERDGILFKGVAYMPTEKNRAGKTVTATAPALRLKNVDLESLMRKHLKADEAELIHPVITVHQQRSRPVRAASIKAPPKNLDVFYETLHGIREMVHVEHFHLRNGELNYKAGGEHGTALKAGAIDAHILLDKLFLSDSLVDIKHAIPDLRIGSLQLSLKGTNIAAHNYRFNGTLRRNWNERLDVKLPGGMHLRADDIYWEVFDWDVFQQTRDIQVDYFRAGSITVNLPGKGKKEKQPPPKHPLPVIRVAKLEADQFWLFQAAPDGSLQAQGGGLLVEQLHTKEHFFAWKDVQLKLSAVQLKKPGFSLETGAAAIFSGKESNVSNIRFVSGTAKVALPALKFRLPVHSSDFSRLEMPYLDADNAEVELLSKKSNTVKKTPSPMKIPLSLHIGEINIDHAKVNYTGIGQEDTMQLHTGLQVKVKDVKTKGDGLELSTTEVLLENSQVTRPGLNLAVPYSHFQLSAVEINDKTFSALAALSWKGGGFQFEKGAAAISGEQLAGKLPSTAIRLHHGEKFNWKNLLPALSAEGGKLNFSNDQLHAGAGSFQWAGNTLHIRDISMQPRLSREETFRKEKWQQDYITVNGGAITITGFDPARIGDTMPHAGKMTLDSLAMTVSRDKHMPLQQGVTKEMPTALLKKIAAPFRIDTVAISNSTIVYAERPAKTDRWNEIPLKNVQGTILNLGNRFGKNDSLLVYASGTVFNGSIRRLMYRESYADSLSGFSARLDVSPIQLPELGRDAMPQGNVSITKGRIDTVFSTWEGNTYAAYGQMHFYYSDLRLRIRDKHHPDKWRLMPAVKTWLANLILPSRITRPSFIFTERNRGKFIFNYWIIVQKSGVMSAVGLKRDRAYRRKYNKYREQYYLPPLSAEL